MTEDLQSTLDLILNDLEVSPDSVVSLPPYTEARKSAPNETQPDLSAARCLLIDGTGLENGREDLALLSTLGPLMGDSLAEGVLFLFLREGRPDAVSLAGFRNSMWPTFFVPVVYLMEKGQYPVRLAVSGVSRLEKEGRSPADAYAVVAVRKEDAMRPEAIREKFDAVAPGWNGVPGAPSYGHFRWMRKIITECALSLPGQRVLDAGCGAGWVGIEAALLGASVASFDPSPEMVRIAEGNARSRGVDLEVRVGFSEDPPFDEQFDTVFSAGVISFSPDHDRFLDGLDSKIKPQGILVIADHNPLSLGTRYRRARHPVLPFRELNALSRTQVMKRLSARGYSIENKWHYQLTLPVPLLMHISENRFNGFGSSLLLALNKAAFSLSSIVGSRSGLLFDSYIIRARKI